MKKNKNRNELSIFEELRLKPSTNARSPEHYPREYSLHKLNVLCKVDKKNNPISWWKKRPNGEFMQVNEFGEMIFSSDKRYEKTIPNFIYSLDYEKLVNEPEIESKKLMKFCDLPWDKKCLEFYKRKDLISKTASNIQIRKAIYKDSSKKYLPYKKFFDEYGKKYSWFNII